MPQTIVAAKQHSRAQSSSALAGDGMKKNPPGAPHCWDGGHQVLLRPSPAPLRVPCQRSLMPSA